MKPVCQVTFVSPKKIHYRIPAFARAHASPFGNRLSEDKITRQQVEGPLESRVITRPQSPASRRRGWLGS